MSRSKPSEGDGERELGIEIIALNCTQVLDAKIKNGQLIGKVRLFPPVGRLQLGGVVFLFSTIGHNFPRRVFFFFT